MKPIESKHPIKEYNGFWWIPNDAENQYFGNLKIDESGEIFLQLFGNSRSRKEEYLYVNHNVMYGICEDGIKITVFYRRRSKGKSSAFYKSSNEYQYCLVGFHAEAYNRIEFDRIQVNFSGLIGWFIEYEFELISQDKERHYIENKLYADETRHISICARNAESSNTKTRRTEIQREEFLKIEYNKPAKYYEIFQELKQLSMLMTLLGREAVLVQEVSIPYKDNTIPKIAQLYINDQTYFRPLINREVNNKHGRSIISQEFQNILSRLYSLNESEYYILEVISDMYLRGPGNSRTDFFNIISAYESWHRNNIVETDDDNVKVYNQLKALTIGNGELSTWVGSKSNLLKGMSLPKRLDYLIEQDEWSLISDKKKFNKVVTETRNMIAHNLKNSKSAANFAEMRIVKNIVHSILEKLFLQSLNLPKEFIDLHTEKHPIVEQTILQIKANKGQIRF